MNLRSVAMLVGTALLAAACGQNTVQPVTPSTPEPTPIPTPQSTPPAILQPSPTPEPSTQPTPSPTPTPCTAGLCEDPVTATTPPARLTVRLFAVENGTGKFWPWDPETPIPIGYFARLDVTGKDVDGVETNGSTDPEWFWSDDSLVKVSGNQTHQRRMRVLNEGMLDVWVTQEGVRSNTLTLKLAK